MPDPDLIVVGNGVAGSAAARAARWGGLTVAHIARLDAPPSSLCALATYRADWTDDDALASASEGYWTRVDALAATAAYLSTWRRPQWRPVDGYYLVDPRRAVDLPDVNGAVRAVDDDGAVHLDDGTSIRPRVGTVVAAGPATAGLVDHPLTRRAHGATARHRDAVPYHTEMPSVPEVGRVPLAVHQYGPHALFTVARLGDTVSVGASTNRDRETAITRVLDLVHRAHGLGLVPDPADPGWRIDVGERCWADRPLTFPSDRVAAIAGLGRVGFTTGPGYALRAVARLAGRPET